MVVVSARKTRCNRIICLINLICLLSFKASQVSAAAQPPGRVLTTAAEVRGMTIAEAERHYPVKLRGVVTFYDDSLFSRFIQDETAGIYLDGITNTLSLQPGQVVEVEGVTGPGEFAPVVVSTSVKVVETGKIPAAKPVSLEQLRSGLEDSQLVEITGTVRAVRFEKESQHYQIDLVMGGERFNIFTKHLPVEKPIELVDSTVRVRGVCSTLFNQQRQLFGFRLLVPNADGLTILKPAAKNPFDLPAQNLNSLMQFRPQSPLGQRIKVAGMVAYYEPGSALFIQDGKQGLYCKTLQRDPVQLGDRVEILGCPANGEYTPILEDAIFRKTGPGPEPEGTEVDLNEVLTGTHDSRLVKIQATVLDRVDRGVNRFLLLKTSDFIFQAYLPQDGSSDQLADVVNGSEVMVTGICLIERGNNWQSGKKWRAKSFRLLLRSPKDVLAL
jgi:hypothetical protein